MKKFPVGIQLYSVRDFAEKDLKDTLKALKEMGYLQRRQTPLERIYCNDNSHL